MSHHKHHHEAKVIAGVVYSLALWALIAIPAIILYYILRG